MEAAKLKDDLQRSVSNPETPEFSNWFNQQKPRENYMWAIRELNTNKPNVLRFLMLIGFNAGLALGKESAEVASSVETPRKPSAAAGSTSLPELWVCEACGYHGDPNDWDEHVYFAGNYWEPKESVSVCPVCSAKEAESELTVEWAKEHIAECAKNNKAPYAEPLLILVETLNDE